MRFGHLLPDVVPEQAVLTIGNGGLAARNAAVPGVVGALLGPVALTGTAWRARHDAEKWKMTLFVFAQAKARE